MNFAEKFKKMRQIESFTQEQLSKETGIAISSVKAIEGGKNDPSFAALMKLINHKTFKPYILWLLTGDTAPSAGQVDPAIRTLMHIEQAEVVASELVAAENNPTTEDVRSRPVADPLSMEEMTLLRQMILRETAKLKAIDKDKG